MRECAGGAAPPTGLLKNSPVAPVSTGVKIELLASKPAFWLKYRVLSGIALAKKLATVIAEIESIPAIFVVVMIILPLVCQYVVEGRYTGNVPCFFGMLR